MVNRTYLEHSWHDRVVREMSSELRLIVGDALHTNDPLAGLEVENLVDKSERVPVRQNLEDIIWDCEYSVRMSNALANIGSRWAFGRVFSILGHLEYATSSAPSICLPTGAGTLQDDWSNYECGRIKH